MPLTVLVTGAGGFVGSVVADDLEARGHTVVRVARRKLPGHDVLLWDLRDTAPAAAAEFTPDVIVHCAASVGTTDRSGVMRDVHVDGTANVLAEFPRARVVHISTAAVYSDGGVGPFTVDDATGDGLLDDYGRTKWAAELVVRADAAGGREAVILRPSLIYGTGDRTVVPGLRSALFAGMLWLPDGGKHRWSVTPVDLLVSAIRSAVELPFGQLGAGGHGVVTRNVVAVEPVLLGELFAELMEADTGRSLRVGNINGGLMRAFGAVNEALWRVFAPRKDPVFTRASIAYVTQGRILKA